MKLNRHAMRMMCGTVEMLVQESGHNVRFLFGVTSSDVPVLFGLGEGAAEQGLMLTVDVSDDIPPTRRAQVTGRIAEDVVKQIEDWKRVNPRGSVQGQAEEDPEKA